MPTKLNSCLIGFYGNRQNASLMRRKIHEWRSDRLAGYRYLHQCLINISARPGQISSFVTMTSLCLVCSSSLPPSRSSTVIFTTNCCQRPICPSCIASNPRLARYDPCLACLVGVGVLTTMSKDTFILGDDDDDEDEGVSVAKAESQAEDRNSPNELSLVPYKYYLNRSDTLQGLSLRFGIDVSIQHLLTKTMYKHNLSGPRNLYSQPSSLKHSPHDTPSLAHTRIYSPTSLCKTPFFTPSVHFRRQRARLKTSKRACGEEVADADKRGRLSDCQGVCSPGR